MGVSHLAVMRRVVRYGKEKRVASKYYFRRYFTYGVPSDDISDREIEQFIYAIPANGIEYVRATIAELSTGGRGDVLIEKLRSYEDDLPLDTAKLLALGIASSGTVLPQSHPVDRFFSLGAYAQAAAMIRHLVDRVPELAEREGFALELADRVEPLPFALDYSRWIRPLKRSHFSEEKVATVSGECEKEIYKRIVKRIPVEANREPLERKFPMDAQGLYQFWERNDREALVKYLQHRFKENQQGADDFIVAVVGLTPASLTRGGLDFPDERGWYALIARMIEPQQLIQALKHTYPEIDLPQYLNNDTGKESVRERAAKWFVKINNAVTREAALKTNKENTLDS